jgi:hypothetical protein
MATSGPIEFVHKNDCNCIVPSSHLIHMKIGQVGLKYNVTYLNQSLKMYGCSRSIDRQDGFNILVWGVYIILYSSLYKLCVRLQVNH